MSGITIRKASRSKAWLKVCIDGVSGSGKTYSSLQIARGLGDDPKVLLIDTENGSGELYSNLYEYDYIRLDPPFTPAKYVEAIQAAVRNGNDVIIVDSMTHCWKYILSYKETLDATNPKAGFTNWAKAKTLFDEMKQALLQCPAHVIATLRAGSEYAESYDSKGNKKFDKVGTKPIAEPDLEYEFTLALRIERSHLATATKDRTEKFDIAAPFTPSPTTGRTLYGWLMEGAGTLERPAGWGGDVLASEDAKRALQEAERIGVGIEGRTQAEIDAEASALLAQKRKEANALMDSLKLKEDKDGLKGFSETAKAAGLDPLEVFYDFSKKRAGMKTWAEFQTVLKEFIDSKNAAEADDKKASPTSSEKSSDGDPFQNGNVDASNSKNDETEKTGGETSSAPSTPNPADKSTEAPKDSPKGSDSSGASTPNSGGSSKKTSANDPAAALRAEFDKATSKVQTLKRLDALGLSVDQAITDVLKTNEKAKLVDLVTMLDELEARGR